MKKNIPKKRDINMLLQAKREIDLRTRSSSIGNKKYSRKQKHKKDYWNEFLMKVHSSDLAA